jgi:hypothetical protein
MKKYGTKRFPVVLYFSEITAETGAIRKSVNPAAVSKKSHRIQRPKEFVIHDSW